MLKASLKLTSSELKKIFTNQKNTSKQVFRSDFFDLKIFPNLVNQNKFAVILSGKQFKSAVLRNKIKRQFYSLIEKFLKENQNLKKENSAFIFYPKKGVINIKFSDLEITVYNELTKTLK